MARGADQEMEIREDEESDEDYDPDISDEEAIRRWCEYKLKRGENVVNHPALCAIIEEITCTNFMCHAHLSIGIGPLINFIIGHNGSGKSAVLSALQICLGSRAGATNRGQSLKELIKQDTERATLRVRIKNQGELAYLPDLYGKSIIVERHFSKSGTSGFSLRNADGKQVSTKKSDLDDILDALALQLDNPMNVLTQDKAREFLNSSSPADKYRFFIQGTHLERLDTDYKVLSDSLENNNTAMYDLKDGRDALEKALSKAAEKVKEAEKTNALHDTANRVRRQIIWSQVRDQEDALSVLDQEINEAETEIQTRQRNADRSGAKYEQAEQARDAAAQTVQQLKDTMEPKQQDNIKLNHATIIVSLAQRRGRSQV
jgi:chromosome segregation ATPase